MHDVPRRRPSLAARAAAPLRVVELGAQRPLVPLRRAAADAVPLDNVAAAVGLVPVVPLWGVDARRRLRRRRHRAFQVEILAGKLYFRGFQNHVIPHEIQLDFQTNTLHRIWTQIHWNRLLSNGAISISQEYGCKNQGPNQGKGLGFIQEVS